MPNFKGKSIELSSYQDDKTTACITCRMTFSSWEKYHQHKMNSRRHITCDVCSQDFNTREACKQHHDLLHSAEQDLQCVRCKKKFTRLGGLISHMELSECQPATRYQIRAAMEAKTEGQETYQNVRNAQPSGQIVGNFPEEPHRFAKSPALESDERGPKEIHLSVSQALGNDAENNVRSSTSRAEIAQPMGSGTENNVPTCAPSTSCDNVSVEVDLIWLDPTEVLNSSWDIPISKPSPISKSPAPKAAENQTALPSIQPKNIVNIMDAPFVEVASHQRGVKQNQVPAVSSVTPSTEPMESLRVSQPTVKEDWSPFDPNNPKFNVSSYFVQFTGKYKCPHRGCIKSYASKEAFVQHLKSSAHRDDKLQCHNCLRYFGTCTALTQHIESQGTRCKVRETEGYSGIVDDVTGGIARTAGRHIDDTVRYAVNANMLDEPIPTVQGFVDAHKAKGKKKDENFNSFWSTHKPGW